MCLISIVVALCQQSTPCESFLLGRTLSFRVLARRSIKATKPWNKHYHDVAVSFSKTTTDPSTPEGELDTSGIKTTKKEQENEKNPLALASWYAVEAFGKLFAPDSSKLSTTDQGPTINLTAPPSSLNETLARIELDFERSYFLSGAVDRLIYDPDCVFSDPFVSFRGRDRFVENLSNLGSFITKYSAKRLQYAVVPDTSTVKTKVRANHHSANCITQKFSVVSMFLFTLTFATP